MKLKEYIQKRINKINLDEDDNEIFVIKIDDRTFKYHNECSATFLDDFFIVKDKTVEIAIPYEKVTWVQNLTFDDMKNEFSEIIESLIKSCDDD